MDRCPKCKKPLIKELRKGDEYWLCKLCRLIFPY